MPTKTYYLLALDPSLRGTGWVVVDLALGEIVAAGVIVTKPRTAQEKKRLLAGEAAGNSGLAISRGIRAVIELYAPCVAVTEAPSGSRSSTGAAAIARSHQACLDAIDQGMGGLPIFVTPQVNQKRATGKQSCSKSEMETAMRARWEGSDFDELLTTSPPYADQGQKLPARGKWENAFDAAGVAHAVWDHPAVLGLRIVAVIP
jgi:Holliday junction resolvasome RuvABC endonuclease subunit